MDMFNPRMRNPFGNDFFKDDFFGGGMGNMMSEFSQNGRQGGYSKSVSTSTIIKSDFKI